MKILHTSDWHLGAAEGTRSLYEDQKFFIDEICDISSEHNADAVIIAGDIFDRSVSSAEAVGLYDYAMTKLCRDLGKKAVVIAGNHDGPERLASCGELLSAAGLYVSGVLSRKPQKVSFDDTDIYMLPWVNAGAVKALFPEHAGKINSPEDALHVMCDEIRKDFIPGKRHFLVSHAFVSGASTSESDRAAVIGLTFAVSSDVYSGFDYVAAGHLHRPQDVTEKIRYSGTPMPFSFGAEESQIKSVTLIDTDDMSRKIIPLPLLHRRITLTGTLDELLHPDCGEDIQNGFVRAVITDHFATGDAFARLSEVYPNLLEMSGKGFDNENSTVTLTLDDIQKSDDNPAEIFRMYCADQNGEDCDERLMKLFIDSVNEVEEAYQ